MNKIIIGGIAALAIALPAAPVASAGPNDSQLCSFNMAYRTMHKSECSQIAINSYGHGGAYDADGDGTPAATDADDHDAAVH